MTTFDTLRAAQRLRDEADQPPAAAETIAAVIGEAVAPGRDDVMGLREDITALRGEVHDEVGALRTELHDEVGALRTELHHEVGALRADVAALRAEVREDIAALRGELREGLQALRTEMQAMRADQPPAAADFQSDLRTLTLQLAGFTVAVAMIAVAVAKLI